MSSLRFEAPTVLDYFATLVADDRQFTQLEAAIAIAQDDDPTLDVQTVLAQIDALAVKLKQRIAADTSPLQKLRYLNRYFFQELGFAGNVNDYYDPDNSYLHRVLGNAARASRSRWRCCTSKLRNRSASMRGRSPFRATSWSS